MSAQAGVRTLDAMQVSGPPRATSPSLVRRLAWLLACVLAGLLIASIGNWLSANTYWYLAIPAVVAVGWLFLANPTQCARAPRKPANEAKDNETAR